MFVRLVYESFRRQTRRKLLMATAVTLGAAVSTAMIAIAIDIGDKISHELRSYGANLVVTPADANLDVQIGSVNLKPAGGAALIESDLPKIKGIFWRNNITGFTPELPVNVKVGGADATLLGTYFAQTLTFGKQEFTTGARKTFPWWKVNGAWPADDSNQVLVGEKLASRLGIKSGSKIQINGVDDPVVGIVSTGSVEDDEIVAPLGLAQRIAEEPGAVGKIFVSAVTKPEDAFARRNPDSLTPADRDRWYCSPYPQSIAFQLQEVIPHSHAEQIRQVAQNEGNILSRIEGLMLLITLAALFTSGLAVSAAMATAMFERRQEIGLMKALGAGQFALSAIFVTEAVLLACAGGLVGFAGGALLARKLGQTIFGSAIAVEPVLLPLILGLAIIVTFAGSAAAIRRAVKYDPVNALRGEA
ncbi:MAG TPA: ABC transporter permease [Terriglobales bacterium]|jgi:putative ABC transport system permease protein|nr:ABC transporter permease [Terriglobales bacterium]